MSKKFGIAKLECGQKQTGGNSVANCLNFKGRGSLNSGDAGIFALRRV